MRVWAAPQASRIRDCSTSRIRDCSASGIRDYSRNRVCFVLTFSSPFSLRTEISAQLRREITRTDVARLFCFDKNRENRATIAKKAIYGSGIRRNCTQEIAHKRLHTFIKIHQHSPKNKCISPKHTCISSNFINIHLNTIVVYLKMHKFN